MNQREQERKDWDKRIGLPNGINLDKDREMTPKELELFEENSQLRSENEKLKASLSASERFRMQDAGSAIDEHNQTRELLRKLKEEITELKTDLERINFWERLKTFVCNVDVSDPISEEEKNMILIVCEEQFKKSNPTQ